MSRTHSERAAASRSRSVSKNIGSMAAVFLKFTAKSCFLSVRFRASRSSQCSGAYPRRQNVTSRMQVRIVLMPVSGPPGCSGRKRSFRYRAGR